MNKKRICKWIILIALGLILILGIACYVYLQDYYHADQDAITAFLASSGDENSETVEKVSTKTLESGEIVHIPENPVAGLIFYPGGKVEASAYVPLMEECSKKGILCILVEMPGNLAVLDVKAADGLPQEFPDVSRWYIAGHSLGGSMAASYAAEKNENLDGVIMLAAYSTSQLQDSKLQVLSIYGSEDGVMDRRKYEENKRNLPKDYVEFIIDGGCHAGFGMYGPQEGDGAPSITGDEQIRKAAEKIYEFISTN